METLKKIYAFFVCIVWAFATIGSTAYLFYHHLPQFAVATIALSAMAFPYAKKQFKMINNF
jgi:hypothetical protein